MVVLQAAEIVSVEFGLDTVKNLLRVSTRD